MTQEEKSLLLKDICARLPYGVKVQYKDFKPIDMHNINAYTVNGTYDIELCKPYLRPMSEIANLISAKKWSSLGGIDLIDWYNANHIDYRGLIEKNLALETPKGIYNTNNE